jgi:hypothetical protein
MGGNRVTSYELLSGHLNAETEDNGCSGLDSNQVLPEYRSDILTFEPTLFCIVFFHPPFFDFLIPLYSHSLSIVLLFTCFRLLFLYLFPYSSFVLFNKKKLYSEMSQSET